MICMKKLTAIEGNTQRLDGGAMFGNAPKAMWSKWLPVDDQNRVTLACRALLVQQDGRNILFETGVGNFFEPKLRQRYGVIEDRHRLLDGLQMAGLSHEDIDIVVLSHLHFDHAGGLLSAWRADTAPQLLFPKAKFLVSARAWQRARQPHLRDRASFIPVINDLLEASGRLITIDTPDSDLLGPDYRFHFSDGHTPGLMMTEISLPDGPLVYVSDLAPGVAWLNQAITMGYDRCAETLIDEKLQLLEDLYQRNARIFFTHDPQTCLCAMDKDERGRFCAIDRAEKLG